MDSRIVTPRASRSRMAGLLASSLPFLVAALMVVFASGMMAQAKSGPSHKTVIIKAMQFQPHTLTLRAGDVVEWKNEDIYIHTATADDGTFNSGPIAPGKSWSTTITKVGTIAYHCTPHPDMTAELIVQPRGTKSK